MHACPANEEYDWHAERCVSFRNTCPQDGLVKLSLYHHCVEDCNVWKTGTEDFVGQFDI